MSFEWMPLVIVGVALVLLGVGGWVLMSRQWLVQWAVGTGGLLLLAGAVWLSVIAVNLLEYDELSGDGALATVNFRETDSQEFIATVGYRDGSSRDYTLEGDLWHMDIRLLQWRGLFAMLGARPGFQPDTLRGRYLALERERARENSGHRLREPAVGLDIWEWTDRHGSLMFRADSAGVDYLPMADGAIFEVVSTPGGIVGRPLNAIAEDALAQWE